jgi:hypothetical protein
MHTDDGSFSPQTFYGWYISPTRWPFSDGYPPQKDNTEAGVPYGSPATPQVYEPSQATALWHSDCFFAIYKSDINKIIYQAHEPISSDINPNNPKDMDDPCLDLDWELLAMLDPAFWSNVLLLVQ